MNNFFKLCFCLILFVLKAHTLSAQVTDALIIMPDGNVNVPNGKVQEKGNDLLPKGAIILWYGGTTAPAGWAICDGTQGTPNLSGRFIVGAGSNGETTYKSGDSGGEDKPKMQVNQLPAHTHKVRLITTENGSHTHNYTNTYILTGEKTNPRFEGKASGDKGTHTANTSTNSNGSHSHIVEGDTKETGNNTPFDNRPKYYALYYIMKL